MSGVSELKTGVAYRQIPAGLEARWIERQFAVPTVVCVREPGVFVPNMARIYRTDLRLVDGRVVPSRSVTGKDAGEAPFVYLVEIPRFSAHDFAHLVVEGWALLTDAEMTAMTAGGRSLVEALENLERP
mgnify:FL=1